MLFRTDYTLHLQVMKSDPVDDNNVIIDYLLTMLIIYGAKR